VILIVTRVVFEESLMVINKNRRREKFSKIALIL